jgi:hypothetical protein
MSRKALLITLFNFAAALVATSAFAEPPVPSWRGNEGTTFQEWSFDTNNVTPAPDTVNNPYTIGDEQVLLHIDTNHGWYDSLSSGQGVWALSGEIDIVIPNSRQTNPYKEIWLYLVWRPETDVVGTPLTPDPFLPDAPLVAVTPFNQMTLTKQFDNIENEWHHTLFVAGIWPNPPKEWITVKGNILVDSLSIETICVPEPTTIAFLTAGGLSALLLRKRTK